MSKVIGVLSGKGGVGKTTLVSNLGASLINDYNRNVLVLDSNIKTSHLGLHLGVYDSFPVTLEEVLKNEVSPTYAIFIHPATGIRILPAPLNAGDVNISRLKKVVKDLRRAYEIIIIDCAPGLGVEVVSAVECIDQAIVVTTPDLPAVTDAMKTIALLEKLDKEVLGIVLNRVRGARFELTEKEIESTCGYRVIGEVPEDSKIPESIATGVPVVIYSRCSKSSRALKKLSAHLIGEEYQPESIWSGIKELFSFGKSFSRESSEDMKPKLVRESNGYAKSKGKKRKDVEEEYLDVQELKGGMSSELKENLKRDIKKRLKKKVLEKMKKRLG